MSRLEHIRPSGLHHNPAYSHVVVASGARTVYIAGQVSTDEEGRIVGEGNLAAQTTQVMQNIGLALAREILVADALRDGRLLRLSPVSMQEEQTDSYWLAFQPSMKDWPPLQALQRWLFEELGSSQRELQDATETRPASRSGSRSRVRSAAPTKRRVR